MSLRRYSGLRVDGSHSSLVLFRFGEDVHVGEVLCLAVWGRSFMITEASPQGEYENDRPHQYSNT